MTVPPAMETDLIQGEPGAAPGAWASKSSHASAFPQAPEPPELELAPELELTPELELAPELEVTPELELTPELDPELELPPELPVAPELEPELELRPELPLELALAPELELVPEFRPSPVPSPDTVGAHATAPVAIANERRTPRRAERRRETSIIAVAPSKRALGLLARELDRPSRF